LSGVYRRSWKLELGARAGMEFLNRGQRVYIGTPVANTFYGHEKAAIMHATFYCTNLHCNWS